MVTKIFISYRRDDSSENAFDIHAHLSQQFERENIFFDKSSIAPGKDFPDEIIKSIRACDILLAVIGPRWSTISDKDGNRRLESPEDYVRREIEMALARDKLVIPVLVNGATMPVQAELPGLLVQLATKQAVFIGNGSDLDSLVEELLSQLGLQRLHERRTRPHIAAQTVPFDDNARIETFYAALDQGDLRQAELTLETIRNFGTVSQDLIQRAQEAVREKRGEQARTKAYEDLKQYTEHNKPRVALEALRVFQQRYPNYDPDKVADSLRRKIEAQHAVRQEERDKAYDQLRQAADHDEPRRILAELKVFQRRYPNYDPEGIELKARLKIKEQQDIYEKNSQGNREQKYSALRLMVDQDEPSQVLTEVEAFLEEYPNYDPDHIHKKILDDYRMQIQTLIEKQEQAVNAKDWEQVILIGRKILKLEHSHGGLQTDIKAKIFATRGLAYHNQNDYRNATADYEAAIKLAPNTAEYYCQLGNSYYENQHNHLAIENYTKAITLDPKGQYYYFRHLTYSQITGKEIESQADLKQAAALGHRIARLKVEALK